MAIGCMEPHKRPRTSALDDGLGTVPRRRLTYRGTELEEMDLPALLGRAPELALIDLTPEALVEPLRAGKVYPGESTVRPI